MEYKEWEAITQHRAALTSYVDVKEVVHYLKCEIEDPPAGTYFSPIDVQLESAEIDQFQDHISIKSLLDYLRRRKNGFNLLCKTLSKTGQSFLVETLQNTKDNIPDVDSTPSLDVPDSRINILINVADKLQSGRSYINLYGEQGVGTSRFLEQIMSYLQEECYFTVKRIDLTDTPLILQQKYFTTMKFELLSKEKAMKKFYVFCVDNCNSKLLQQKPKHHMHQNISVANWIANCKNNLGISLLTTASNKIEGLDNIEVSRLPVSEMGQDIQKMFSKIDDSEMKELIAVFPETCNPLDCFLLSTLYMLHHKTIDHVKTFLKKHPVDTRNELFAAVFNKLSRTQQDILLSVYSLPCNGKVSLPSIYSLYHGSSRPPEEERIHLLEIAITELVAFNLLQKKDDRYSMKDSNFFYHFRAFFKNKHPKRLRVYYLRGLHYYLDYTIKIIQDVHSLNEFKKTQAEEWDDTIPRISFVLDPSERKLEEDILRKPLISKPLYNKRMFVIEKLRDIALHVPNATLILSAQNLLDDFDTHHYKHADIEDKAKLLCLITELSLTPDCRTEDCRDNLQRAMVEVKNLLEKKKSAPELRVKYYLRILIPLGEIYVRERSYEKARDCFRECLKLKCDNKTINWLLRKRLRFVSEILKNPSSSELESPTDSSSFTPLSPVDVTSRNFLSHDIKYHLEMGDNFYIRGELTLAFNYYFELWRKFHSQHLHLKEQEYILLTMGHLKLQKHSRLVASQVLDAIRFYEQSQGFYKLRKDHLSEYLKICLFTANLLAGKKRVARDFMLQFRNAQHETRTAFFMALLHRETNHRLMWRELTYTEKEHQTNRIKPRVVNYYMVEEAHYKIKSSEMFTSDKTKFLMFPGTDKLLENVDLFDPTPLYRQDDQHLAVYIKLPTTKI